MKSRIGILLMAVMLLFVACKRKEQHQFTHDLLLSMTPVKNQGKSELCWAYAMLATIETEHILRGDSVNLSAVYIGRRLSHYQQSIGHFSSSQRAMGMTLLNMISQEGVVGYDVLPDDASDDMPTPQWVFLLGARYTPQEFAHSVCAPDEYLALTCWPDSPYYKKVEIDVPDNWEHNRLMNLPLDTLRKHVDNAAYYVMKNSWGTKGSYGGLVYMSVRKMWKDMIAVYLTREAYER